MMKPAEIIETIESMDNSARFDTLELLYNTYFYMGISDEERQVLKDYYEGTLVKIESEE
ncbi:MAG: hypothetical protein FWF59_08200 [Turicibacter sp.]|nr:hypothetical protein [Turicibacter sp.]